MDLPSLPDHVSVHKINLGLASLLYVLPHGGLDRAVFRETDLHDLLGKGEIFLFAQ